MDPVTLSALIGGGVALGTSALNAGFTVGRNRASRKWTEEQWSRENEYNLPVNQVQRLKDAGLNPYLAYSQGSVTGSTSAQSHNYTPDAIQFENPAPYLSSFAQVKKTQAETDNLTMNSLYQAQQIRNLATQQFLMQLQSDKQAMDNKVFYQTMPFRLQEFKLGMNLLNAEIAQGFANSQNSLAQKNLAIANTAHMMLQNDYFHRDKEQQYMLQNLQAENTKAATTRLRRETDILNMDVNTYMMRFQNEMKNSHYSRQYQYSLKKTEDAIRDLRVTGLDEQNRLSQWDREYREKYGLKSENVPSGFSLWNTWRYFK